MTLQRARSVDELYTETRDYDLVLTTDGPLSLALNRRLDQPRLGRFAATPRMLASGEFAPHDERSLFIELVDKTDLSWKYASYLVDNILRSWEETGEIDAILGFDRYDTEATREAIDVIKHAESSHGDLADYTIDDDLDVAVIGEEQFTTLDCSILSDEYDTISPFASNAFDLPEFCLFDSATAIVETVVDAASPANAEDIAVVMHRGSEYPALVESAFESTDIPYYGGPGFVDDTRVRTFLRLLRAALSSDSLRLSDVRPVLTAMDIDPPVEHDRRRLRSLDHPELDPLQAFCASVGEHTVDEALSTYEGWSGEALGELRDELRQLGLLERSVDDTVLDDLDYYFQSFDVPAEEDQEGVLLASATSAAYVDRPIVFYLGLDAGWTHSVPDKPWVDADQKDRQYLQQFQILLQNGAEQYYLVQDTQAGESVTPCLYFHDLLDVKFDCFSDLPHVPYARRSPRQTDTGFEKESIDVVSSPLETISQSSLSTLVNCPRDYYFDRLVEGPDRDYLEKGNLFHDFAEFYVVHPGAVETAGIDTVIDLILDAMEPYADNRDLATLESELRVGVESIVRYLDDDPPEESSYDAYVKRGWGNRFADHFGRTIDSPITEQWFENASLSAKGKIDLIHAPSRLLDYKSGRHKSPSTVVKNARIDEISDTPNFQALLYLAQHRDERPGERLEFRLFHFLETLDDAITGDDPPPLDEGITTLTYYPTPFEEHIQRETTFEVLREDGSNKCQKTFEQVEYETYRSFLDGHDVPTTYEKDELLDSAFADALVERMKTAVGDHTYVETGCAQALRQLLGIRTQNYFGPEVDAFEVFLKGRLDELNDWRVSRFPVSTDLAGEQNFDRVDHRDLLLTDERTRSPSGPDSEEADSGTQEADR
jgi:hypothetical protein